MYDKPSIGILRLILASTLLFIVLMCAALFQWLWTDEDEIASIKYFSLMNHCREYSQTSGMVKYVCDDGVIYWRK